MSSESYPDSEPPSYTVTWVFTLLLIVSFLVGLVFYPPLFEDPTTEAPGLVLFFGRFHPILLHLPVGALIVLCLMEFACITQRGEEKLGSAALFTLWVGSAGSVLAVIAGIMLSREGGYAGANFSLHQTLALLGTAGLLLALVIRIYAMSRGQAELMHAYRSVFFLSFGVMGLGAHFGGNMSHGSKFLTEHAPEPLKTQMVGFEKWMLGFAEKPKASEPTPQVPAPTNLSLTPIVEKAKEVEKPTVPALTNPATPAPEPQPPAMVGAAPTPPAAAEKTVFEHVILPIFEAKCNKCHNEDKSKGDLRLDNFEVTMKGGENGNNIVPGKPDESLTLQRINLPLDDDEHMPPDGKDQLTPAEVAAIRHWISTGAKNDLKLSEANFPPEAKEALPQ